MWLGVGVLNVMSRVTTGFPLPKGSVCRMPPTFYFLPGKFPGSAAGFSAWPLLRKAHTARTNRLHKLIIFQAGFSSPIKNRVFYLENLNSCVLQMQKREVHSYLPQCM